MYQLIWRGEVIDSFTTYKEALEMAYEYTMAFGSPVRIEYSETETA